MKMEISDVKPDIKIKSQKEFYMKTEGTIEVIEEVMKARDELFEKKLTEGLKQHRNLPHQS